MPDNMFRFTCFNVEVRGSLRPRTGLWNFFFCQDPHDPTVGLINGELVIPGNLLRREVFDPVVGQVWILTHAENLDR